MDRSVWGMIKYHVQELIKNVQDIILFNIYIHKSNLQIFVTF
jgi:hypothetical protein